jgi:hypothetical protein
MTKDKAEAIADAYNGRVTPLINEDFAVEIPFESFEDFVKGCAVMMAAECSLMLAHGRIQLRWVILFGILLFR